MSKYLNYLNILRMTQWGIQYTAPSPGDIRLFRRHLGLFASLVRSTIGVGSVFARPCGLAEIPAVLTGDAYDELDLLLGRSTTYENIICRHALEWACLCDQGHSITEGREDLYDFLIGLVNRRIMLYYEKGYIEIGDVAIPVLNWLDWPEEAV